MLNFEDAEVRRGYCSHNHVGQSQKKFNVLVLRDPFNLMASRWRMMEQGRIRRKSDSKSLRLWKQHAYAYLGLIRRPPISLIAVNYDLWFINEEYRRRLSTRFGLPFTDRGLHDVLNIGRGSSFDGLKLDGQAQRMDTLNRWKEYKCSRRFLDLFDREILDLAATVFSEIEAIRPMLRPTVERKANEEVY